MKTKSLILICIMLTFVVLIIMLNSTVFCVNNIQLQFLSTQNFVTLSNDEILKKSNLDVSGSIFLVNKKHIKECIQSTFPYIKVINIESVFPNKIKINVIERQKFYAVCGSDGFYICDDGLGIIEKVEAFSSTNNNPIILNGLSINSNQKIGMEINIDSHHLDIIKNLSHCLLEWETDIAILCGNISSIQVNYSKENQILISLFSGTSILVENSHINLSNKLNYAFSYYDKNKETQNGGIIKIIDSSDGYTKLIFSN